VIPLKDENSTLSTPILSYIIIGICVVVFLIQISSPGFNNGSLFYSYGVIPASLLGTETLPNDLNKIDPYLTLITSMFMHGGFMHLIGNMLYMWIFADNIEDDLGKVKFILFYLASGVAAAMTQVYLNVNSTIPMVGASGAISGVLGAYLVRYPRNKVLVLIPFGFFTQMVRIPAMFVLGFWFILQFISSSGSTGQGGVAYGAHIGGFVFGAVVMFFFGNFLIPQKAFFKALNEKDGKKKNPWIQD
jgi:membrane associated rhomboid family serine protease